MSYLQNNVPLIMFLAFVGLTLLITFWAAKRNTGASAYFAAGRSITGWQNGFAVAGDYMSAASFLGISGMIYVACPPVAPACLSWRRSGGCATSILNRCGSCCLMPTAYDKVTRFARAQTQFQIGEYFITLQERFFTNIPGKSG